jgi:16S rRNA A1518/A1519 N6-dimethyltransferase RsmA/KsgA/DIM1 with predicted DNA glycosylase/AP lyase activity
MRPKKSLGQNFLRDPKILQKIADAAQILKEDLVVEIGLILLVILVLLLQIFIAT